MVFEFITIISLISLPYGIKGFVVNIELLFILILNLYVISNILDTPNDTTLLK